MSQPIITLYTAATGNGHKVSIALEILNIPYKVYNISFAENEQKADWFLKINPNGRIPAIVDHSNGDFAVFESGAILLYLVQNYDPEHKLWPKDTKLQSEVIQWLMFQMGGVGPMQGQAYHFSRYAPEKIEYGINRYINETNRLYTVLDQRLQGRNYLVGERLTIADVATVPWITTAYRIGIDIGEFINLEAWLNRVETIPEVIKGYDIPTKNLNFEYKNNPELLNKKLNENASIIQEANKL
jgi:glutathione S-transferase